MKQLDQFSYTELPPILSTEGMRQLDAATKEEMAKGACCANKIRGDGKACTAIEAGYELMKLAGAALYNRVVEILDGEDVCCGAGNAPGTSVKTASRAVAVFVGGGNNGGDGLVLAKLLIEAGIPCTTYSLAAAEKFKNEAKIALDDFAQAGGRLTMYSPVETAPHTPRFADFNLIVDCMLGNGASGELRELFAAAVRDIGAAGVRVVAADAPTGYDSSEHGRRAP